MMSEFRCSQVPEIFNGDGCDVEAANVRDPNRVPVRKATVVAIRCEPCVPVDAPADAKPEFDKLCSITREDPCTLRAVLALKCPPRELVYAPNLDVGTKVGGTDVVFAGVPATCTDPPSMKDTASRNKDAAAEWAARRLGMLPNAKLPSPLGLLGSSTPTPMAFYPSLLHGSLAMAPPRATATAAGFACTTRVDGDGPAARGGVLRSVDAPQPLYVSCSCRGTPQMAAERKGEVTANVTLVLHLSQYTSPVIDYQQRCVVALGKLTESRS